MKFPGLLECRQPAETQCGSVCSPRLQLALFALSDYIIKPNLFLEILTRVLSSIPCTA